jgi:GTP cyclohydrolase FolE2
MPHKKGIRLSRERELILELEEAVEIETQICAI